LTQYIHPPGRIASSKPTITVEQAIANAEKILDGKYNDHPATLEYVAKEDLSVVLTHVVQIQNDSTGAWVEAFIDAHSGELVTITDFVTKATVSTGSRFVFSSLVFMSMNSTASCLFRKRS